MALLHILQYPHPGLREKALPITVFEKSITQLAENMLETMYEAPGIGLAATQVQVAKQLVVIDTSENKDSPLIIINPKIIDKSDVIVNEEGCLSFPGIYANVTRSERLILEYQDIKGEVQRLEADDLLAICIQHEMDHLIGKVFVDYLSPLKRNRIRKQLEKLQRGKS
ncbi:MAG: peptide deformylase [Gammaproteobacteria bacterium]|nr:MAG: peptide deformylase [Gammaproteobacteria bacterium]